MREDIKINDRALALQDQIIEKLEKVFDTDVELDVYNLGLIYEINLDETGLCKIVMTFTDTACDCAESLPIEIVAGLKQIEGIEDVKVGSYLVACLEDYKNQSLRPYCPWTATSLSR